MFIQSRRRQLSQVFLTNPQLVSRLVRESSITKNDTVIEIGPGKGAITRELLERARQVMAIEIDQQLGASLVNTYTDNPSFILFTADFLTFILPKTPYKVFSNIPFHIEGEILRKLLADKAFREGWLVVLREVGMRWAGLPHEGEFSVLHKPWFDFSIAHYFNRRDFNPQPTLDTVLLRIIRRDAPLITKEQEKEWERFVRIGFGGGRRLKQNLRPLFSVQTLQKTAERNRFSINDKPSDLTIEQWLMIFKEHKRNAIHYPNDYF